jgi:hypothetical protein
MIGCATAEAVSRWLPAMVARVHTWAEHVGFVVAKWHWGRFSLSTSVSTFNHHFTKIIHHHNHPGLAQ